MRGGLLVDGVVGVVVGVGRGSFSWPGRKMTCGPVVVGVGVGVVEVGCGVGVDAVGAGVVFVGAGLGVVPVGVGLGVVLVGVGLGAVADGSADASAEGSAEGSSVGSGSAVGAGAAGAAAALAVAAAFFFFLGTSTLASGSASAAARCRYTTKPIAPVTATVMARMPTSMGTRDFRASGFGAAAAPKAIGEAAIGEAAVGEGASGAAVAVTPTCPASGPSTIGPRSVTGAGSATPLLGEPSGGSPFMFVAPNGLTASGSGNAGMSGSPCSVIPGPNAWGVGPSGVVADGQPGGGPPVGAPASDSRPD